MTNITENTISDSNLYDEEIKFLTEYPEEIKKRQYSDANSKGLFRSFDLKDTEKRIYINHCPTEIKNNLYKNSIQVDGHPELKQLVEDIRNDTRMPADNDLIIIESLPVFKEYQERYDVIMSKLVH